jgi:plasmid stabilization system protein ParE
MAFASVIFHRLALREYRTAILHYRTRSWQAASRFVKAVDAAIQRIASAPDRWPVIHVNYRWVRTRRFPYIVYYRILDPDHVLIVAVAHGRRRPGYWLRRWRP